MRALFPTGRPSLIHIVTGAVVAVGLVFVAQAVAVPRASGRDRIWGARTTGTTLPSAIEFTRKRTREKNS